MPAEATQSVPRFTIFLVLIWMAVVVSGFWWFQFKDLREFGSETEVVFFEGHKFDGQLAALVKTVGSNTDRVTLVHFWDPDCSCNRFNEPHVKELIEKYAQQNIQFVIVARTSQPALKNKVLARARQTFSHPAVVQVISEQDVEFAAMPSTPSVAVLNEQNKLMYFGPYSVGAVCNVKNGAFVEKTLEQMSKGQDKKQLNVLATGCFCSWGDKNKSI